MTDRSIVSSGKQARHNPAGAVLHPHPERWRRSLWCVLCMATDVELRSHAHELWCVPCLKKAVGHIARIAAEARELRKQMRLPAEELKKRRHESGSAMRRLRPIIGERDNWICQECGKHCENDAHVDHIRPIAFGGTEDPENLQVLCPSCNHHKNAFASPRTAKIRQQAMANAQGGLLLIDPYTGRVGRIRPESEKASGNLSVSSRARTAKRQSQKASRKRKKRQKGRKR